MVSVVLCLFMAVLLCNIAMQGDFTMQNDYHEPFCSATPLITAILIFSLLPHKKTRSLNNCYSSQSKFFSFFLHADTINATINTFGFVTKTITDKLSVGIREFGRCSDKILPFSTLVQRLWSKRRGKRMCCPLFEQATSDKRFFDILGWHTAEARQWSCHSIMPKRWGS